MAIPPTNAQLNTARHLNVCGIKLSEMFLELNHSSPYRRNRMRSLGFPHTWSNKQAREHKTLASKTRFALGEDNKQDREELGQYKIMLAEFIKADKEVLRTRIRYLSSLKLTCRRTKGK